MQNNPNLLNAENALIVEVNTERTKEEDVEKNDRDKDGKETKQQVTEENKNNMEEEILKEEEGKLNNYIFRSTRRSEVVYGSLERQCL